MNKVVDKGGSPSTLYLPSHPLVSLIPSLSGARFARAKFSSFFLPSFFPIFLSSPSPPRRLPLPPSNFPSPSYHVHLLVNKLPKVCTAKIEYICFYIIIIVFYGLCRNTTPRTSFMDILSSSHHEKTIIFVILFFFVAKAKLFCFCFYFPFFFAFFRNYEKTKVIVMSG